MIQSNPHILVIRLSAMGDVAMSVPVLRLVMDQNPLLKITVLTRPFLIPLFDQIPGVKVLPIDVKGRHKGILGLWRLSREIKKLEIDAIADLHNVLRTKVLKFFMFFSAARFVQIDKGRKEKVALTSSTGKVLRQLKTSHQRYADVFQTLGFKADLNVAYRPPDLHLTEELSARWPIRKAHHVSIGIAPFAQYQGKVYPEDLMLEVIAKLSATNNLNILLFGGGEAEFNRFEQWAAKHENVYNVANQVSFKDELKIIANLDVMLSMDSGNGHLAAIYGVPTVTVWGVTHPFAGFAPFNQPMKHAILPDLERFPLIPTSIYGNKFPDGYEDVMRSIRPDAIVEKILELISNLDYE